MKLEEDTAGVATLTTVVTLVERGVYSYRFPSISSISNSRPSEAGVLKSTMASCDGRAWLPSRAVLAGQPQSNNTPEGEIWIFEAGVRLFNLTAKVTLENFDCFPHRPTHLRIDGCIDLDAPGALSIVDRWADSLLAKAPTRITSQDVSGAGLVRETVDALFGISL